MKSILQDEKECFLCKTTMNLHKHHIVFGTADRKVSDRLGVWCWLCSFHHNGGSNSAHYSKEVNLYLKQKAQEEFERRYDHDAWMKAFGRSWL